ncbi:MULTISPECIES: orotate phosphoribosyltransferase [Fervidobacterium]|uniref:Orotate phosphoribosyltransferase n=1 Tax=Fervidobacterium nodosum (strain ATCC 35602 / DSM 5306 / Rt17-B1) TaxID=381764 RepID=A7HK91_FERNB|nr:MULTISPECIES: orotate phosphoribosyltransferase [Fervidobacterium]ABS60324.1 orotate phosphoribosyltransferase [Fervidobacterium nodosum Rt17-B1]KAF2961405.1 orotate phosphoribosyltransferase [Fervidobacterium sp. 2310opik-2]PHJ13728.1 orotate phosphoribosyltransferase [Fervidobacterium sp. SC_NGM5_G05]
MERVIEILKKTQALLEGHFILSSGLHSTNYVQCAKVFEYPEYGQEIGRLIAEKVKEQGIECTVVIGPALGGVIVAYEVAKFLGVRSMFTEREDGVMKLRRGFDLTTDDKVLIVEDVVTTGKSTFEVVEVVNQYSAEVVGFASIINRSGKENPFEDSGKKYTYLVKFDFPTYKPEECPLCKVNIPAVKPGSRNIKK